MVTITPNQTDLLHIAVIAPITDFATFHSNYLAHRVVEKYRQLGHHVRMISGPFMIPKLVRATMMCMHWDMVIYFGHGTDYALKYFWADLINTSQVPEKLPIDIFYAFACDSAEGLGPSMIQAGIKAYIGNTEPMWGAIPEKKRNFAADFRDIIFQEIDDIIMGNTVGKAANHAIRRWNLLAETYTAAGWIQEANMVTANADFHLALGDLSTTIRRVNQRA